MVRVTNPPGGATKLDMGSEEKRETKTVRVLNPPGGVSSINFSEGDDSKRSIKKVSQQTSVDKSDAATSASNDQTTAQKKESSLPATETNGKNSTTPSEGNLKNTDNLASPPSGTENSVTAKETVTGAASPSTVPTESPLDNECKESSLAEAKESLPDVVEKENISKVSDIEQKSVEESTRASEVTSIEETCNERSTCTQAEVFSSETVEQSVSASSESSHCETSTTSQEEKISSESSASETLSSSQTCSVADTEKVSSTNAELNNSQTVGGKTSENVESQKLNQNAEQQQQPPQQQQQQPQQQQQTQMPRKIKDHMRSNIFLSDEDDIRTQFSRTSRNAATINNVGTAQNVPAAGQRQGNVPKGLQLSEGSFF